MTDEFDATRRTREPFDDPVTGDQTVPDQDSARQPEADLAAPEMATAGVTSGLPGEVFAKPDPDQPAEGRRDQAETYRDPGEAGREADADAATRAR